MGFGVGDEIACLDASENVGGADISALIGLARPFVRELVCVFVALDADVGRDPFHVDMVVGEGGSIELPDSAS